MGDYGKTGKPGTVRGSCQRHGLRAQSEIPVNIERVLLRAAEDGAFRGRLLEDPAGALEGESLTGSERAMLLAMNRSILTTMIDRFVPGEKPRSGFARKVASAVAGTLLLTTAACGSGDDMAGGAGPDMPPDGYDVEAADMPDISAGVDPGWPDPDAVPDPVDEPVSDLEDDDAGAEDAEDAGEED
jgi:hypothetical protein